MSQTSPPSVRLVEGNETVGRLMAESLQQGGFEVRTSDGQGLADLLVVDVDSGLDHPLDLRGAYLDAQRAVLVCGVRSSRQSYPDVQWHDRPFDPGEFAARCAALVGEGKTETDGLNTAGGGIDDDPTPQVLTWSDDDADQLDARWGTGGAFTGGLQRRKVPVDELSRAEAADEPARALKRSPLHETMPDAPAAIVPEAARTAGGEAGSAAASSPGPVSAPSSHGSSKRLPPHIDGRIDAISTVLADSWGAIGGASRPGDRAGHIRNVLRAAFAAGLDAATAEVQRIPGAGGFSGDLEALDLSAILRTIRDRGLRGRLEVSAGDDDFVLYLDRHRVAGLENISGDDDSVLLDILVEQGAISDELRAKLDRPSTAELEAPLQTRLNRENGVSADDLDAARRRRIVQICDRLGRADRGRFAFTAQGPDSGHAWPVDGLSVAVDTLLSTEGREHSTTNDGSTDDTSDALTAADPFERDDHLPETLEFPDNQ